MSNQTNNNRSAKLLEKVRELLKEEGYDTGAEEDQAKIIKDYILPALESNKDIQRLLYYDFYKPAPSFLSNLKMKVVNKIANVTRNTVERSIVKQQKYNNNIAYLLQFLLEENNRMNNEIEELKKDGNKHGS